MLCWFTGWLNLLGQVAFTSATELVLVYFLLDLVSLHMSGAHGESLMACSTPCMHAAAARGAERVLRGSQRPCANAGPRVRAEGPGYKATTEVVALCFAGMLALQALMCSITQKFSAVRVARRALQSQQGGRLHRSSSPRGLPRVCV